MEENKKFRNHFSIVFEQMGTGFWIFVSVFIFEFLSDPEFIADVETLEASGKELIIGSGIILIIIAILIGIQIIIWSKTFISIQGNTLVIERNTIKKKKNTIGLQNISNINTEQNLFEMLMGTCKVKLDTNSMSTADSTDVKIVLKKADAEKFKMYLQSITGKERGQSEVIEEESFIQNVPNDVEQMMMHGLFSINGLVVILLVGCMIGIGKSLGSFSGGLISALSSILVMLVFAFSIAKDIVDGFIKYYGFQVKRVEDKIYITYGLLKKVNYVIPVDKINGVKLIQSPQARLAGWYTVQIINVGVGDEEQEEQSFLLYEKKEGIAQKINMLLPEFSGCMTQEIPRQPREVWYVWLLPILGYIGGLILTMVIGLEFWREHFLGFILAAVVISFLGVIELTGRYMTAGSVIGDKMLSITHGCLGKSALFVKYPKIQYLEVKQNFWAKKLHIQKADIYLLASTRNRCQSIPYFYEEEVEILKGHICN